MLKTNKGLQFLDLCGNHVSSDGLNVLVREGVKNQFNLMHVWLEEVCNTALKREMDLWLQQVHTSARMPMDLVENAQAGSGTIVSGLRNAELHQE